MPEIRPDQLSASTVLLARGGKFFVYEPGLGVIASGDSAQGAYERFSDVRQQFLADVEHAGLTAGRPPAQFSRQSVGRELGTFFAKVCIVLLVLAAIAIPAALSVGQVLEQTLTAVSNSLASTGAISLRDVVQKAADIAKDARDLPPDKKESLRQSIGAISHEVSPFVDAWRNPPDPVGAPAEAGSKK